MRRAACRDQAPNRRENPDARDPWYPEQGESPNAGKMVCFTCPVRPECKSYRNYTGTRDGMWGGEILDRNGNSHVRKLGS